MTLSARKAVPGYPYFVGEQLEYVVDPHHKQRTPPQPKMLQHGLVVNWTETTVLLRPIGEPWPYVPPVKHE
jgi:hypothetical protein